MDTKKGQKIYILFLFYGFLSQVFYCIREDARSYRLVYIFFFLGDIIINLRKDLSHINGNSNINHLMGYKL